MSMLKEWALCFSNNSGADDVDGGETISAEPKILTEQRRQVFKVKLNKPAGEGLGLKVDVTFGAHAHLFDIIEDGPVARYNAENPREVQILPGDFLISVNGVRAMDGGDIVEAIHKPSECVLEIARPEFWEVRLERKSDEQFGLGFTNLDDSRSLVVNRVVTGTIIRWNTDNPRSSVRVGDRIISVNCGSAGNSGHEMLEALKHTTNINMQVARPYCE
jgi:hypothetical protein